MTTTQQQPGVSAGWVTEADVQAYLGHGPFTADDHKWLSMCVDAANFAVHFWRPDLPIPKTYTGGPFSPAFSRAFARSAGSTTVGDDPMTRHGAVKLAASMFNRRNSAGADIEAYAAFGGAPPSGLIDMEVQAFLLLGRHHDPLIA